MKYQLNLIFSGILIFIGGAVTLWATWIIGQNIRSLKQQIQTNLLMSLQWRAPSALVQATIFFTEEIMLHCSLRKNVRSVWEEKRYQRHEQLNTFLSTLILIIGLVKLFFLITEF